MSLQPINLIGFDSQGGLKTNKKPFLIPDQAFQRLENAYAFRDRVRKREGVKFLGRLQRTLSGQTLGNTPAGPPNTVTFNDIFTTLGITGENPQIRVGSLVISVGAPDTATFTDQGNGTFAVTGAGVASGSYIDYVTGKVVLQFTGLTGGAAITANFSYYPGLPVMGIPQREIATLNTQQTIWFDTKYAYVWSGTAFTEFIVGTSWDGTDSDFFWTTNYRGVNPEDRLFFATNFKNTAANPMRYTDGTTWTTFAPLVDATHILFQARILIPYFGRLLAFNVWEGTNIGSSVNIFNRCRFSQIGSPVAADAWRSDQFGKGGFLDAPTNEAIISATFLNNTLIVFFERTTWQLRYVGEYGLPFIWERIASDLGSESTFSSVLFNQNILSIGDKAITAADATGVARIDLEIPDEIFAFQNANNGPLRVQGIRDYQKELVYWCYADAFTQAAPGTDVTFPNKVLVYNYRNNTWAIFRDNVTAFGTFQETTDITWDSQVVYWDSEIVTWDDFDTQSRFPLIISGNQQGFVNFYQIQGPQGTAIVPANEQPSLSITGVSLSGNDVILTIVNHNLLQDEIIYLSNLMFINSSTFLPVTTNLNDQLYKVQVVTSDTVRLSKWDFESQRYYNNFSYTPDLSTSTYIGGGLATLFPAPAIQTKDFNPFQTQGTQTKLSYIDFLLDTNNPPPSGEIIGATQSDPCVIESTGHGLFTGQSVFIFGVLGMTQLNTSMNYKVIVIDDDHFSININSSNYSAYSSGGIWILAAANMSVQLFLNSSPSVSGNILVGNQEVNATNNAPFYRPFYSQATQYSWHRFYSTTHGQYFNLLMTYDDNLMNTIYTHTQQLTINAINLWVRPGGKIVF